MFLDARAGFATLIRTRQNVRRYTNFEKGHLENARYASKQDAGSNCKFSTLHGVSTNVNKYIIVNFKNANFRHQKDPELIFLPELFESKLHHYI